MVFGGGVTPELTVVNFQQTDFVLGCTARSLPADLLRDLSQIACGRENREGIRAKHLLIRSGGRVKGGLGVAPLQADRNNDQNAGHCECRRAWPWRGPECPPPGFAGSDRATSWENLSRPSGQPLSHQA